ncbi:MAG: terpene cyclase/mutase family protein [Gemmatales bacterium]|nr:terpene cyclase/mutase family protein [Gemmatales bacterium]MDW8387657.1 terpene cyclase/mutase family protein [Gemmatales bacterium]
MRRWTWIVLILLGPLPGLGQEPTAEEKAATLKYLASLRRADGGYAAENKPDSPATVAATSSALRAIRYFGGKPDDPQATARFLLSCRHVGRGGFGPTPGSPPEVRVTALGLMACKELPEAKLTAAEVRETFTGYLATEAKSFEDIRIAAAAYEAWYKEQPDPALETVRQKWLAEVLKERKSDGTFGDGEGAARQTASAVVTVLRLGGSLDDASREAAKKLLLTAQRPDGGWGKADSPGSDLETTYRVMRCLHMLGVKPDVGRCRAFVAKCRQSDGSYAVQPGQPGNVSATYFAGIVLHWLE